jgi:hypothetical protein
MTLMMFSNMCQVRSNSHTLKASQPYKNVAIHLQVLQRRAIVDKSYSSMTRI